MTPKELFYGHELKKGLIYTDFLNNFHIKHSFKELHRQIFFIFIIE